MLEPNDALLGWRPEEMTISEATRNSRLRWAIVVVAALSAGAAVNAVACVAVLRGPHHHRRWRRRR